MKALILNHSPGHFHFARGISKELSLCGFSVSVWFTKEKGKRASSEVFDRVEKFKEETSGFSWGWAMPRTDFFAKILFSTRALLNYRRYLCDGGQSVFYRERTIEFCPAWIRFFFYNFRNQTDWLVKKECFFNFLVWVENITPPDKKILEAIKKENPDVVVATAGNMQFSAPDVEHIKAAKSLGLPTVLLVKTWDSLTLKGYVHVKPDVVLAWNDAHKRESRHHSIDPNTVRIVGAPVYDEWFEISGVFSDRKKFCEKYGLDSSLPYILYLCSAPSIAEDERWLISEMRSALDSSPDKKMSEIQILVRSHPSSFETYKDYNPNGVRVISEKTSLPGDPTVLQNSYDMYKYALACVGVNTSAMIEAIISDAPVIAIEAEKYDLTQKLAEHFRHLLEVEPFPFVKIGDGFLLEVAALQNGIDRYSEKRRKAVHDFIRPAGLDKSVSKIIANEISKLANKKIK